MEFIITVLLVLCLGGLIGIGNMALLWKRMTDEAARKPLVHVYLDRNPINGTLYFRPLNLDAQELLPKGRQTWKPEELRRLIARNMAEVQIEWDSSLTYQHIRTARGFGTLRERLLTIDTEDDKHDLIPWIN